MNEGTKPARVELGPGALRAVMERLARGNDDNEGALLVLLAIRTFALERSAVMEVELSPQEDVGLLLTIEEPHTGLWHAELLRVTMPTLRRVLSEMPELLHPFDQTERDGTLTLRTKAVSVPSAMAARMTPVALPSLDLLLAAGFLPGPLSQRSGVS
jgi:hypothetical protein